MSEPRFVPLQHEPASDEELLRRSRTFLAHLRRRRTVRAFSRRPVPREVVENCLLAAGSAPSGANRQPWRFVVVGPDREMRRRIREAAEEEERRFYRERAPADWLEALAPLGTDEHKPFIEEAPWLVVIFAESYQVGEDGTRRKNYYVTESVGIATGMLITAFHDAGLATLTHTPSPMGFLNRVLGRPDHERPFLVLVVGHPAEDAQVPEIGKKALGEIAVFLEEGGRD